MKIAIIGSGNIATFFATKFASCGHEIIQVISPNADHATEFARQFNCDYSTSINELKDETEVCVLAVKDDIIQSLLTQHNFNHKILIHTAGSITLGLLSNASPNTGCIWCMYSINKNHLPLRTNIPLIVNASNEATLNIVSQLASCISTSIYSLSDEQKLKAHLAAVFANNFANHMFSIGQDILQAEDIPFQLLVPLIENTVEKLNYSNPDKLQTGPAIRHDQETIQKHLNMLTNNETYFDIYTLITSSIQSKYQ